MGRLAAAEGKLDEALDFFWQGLRHAETEVTATFLESGLGDVYAFRRNVDLALAHYRTVQAVRERIGDQFRLCSVLCDIAELSIETGDLDSSTHNYSVSLELALQAGRLEVAARCYYGLGVIGLATKNLSAATRNLHAALNAFEQLGRDREIERVKALLPEAASAEQYSLDVLRPTTPPLEGRKEVVLINAPRHAESTGFGCQDHRMPLGLMTMSTFLKRRGVSCGVIDAEATGCGFSGIIDQVSRLNPTVVGVNCHTLNRHVVFELLKVLRSTGPNRLLVLGGAHAALAPELTLSECAEADVVVTGEGERTLYELCRRKDSLHLVPGICCRRNGRLVRTPTMPRIQNLDIVGFPDLDDLPVASYLGYEEAELPGLWRRAYLSATRGCRYSCSYCTEQAFWTKGVTYRTALSVIEEIWHYIRNHGVRRFYFYDDTFTDWPGLEAFCELASDVGIEWSCSTRIDAISSQLLLTMQRGGCREIAFGLESGSQRSLVRMSKGLKLRPATTNEIEPSVLWDEIGARIQMSIESSIKPRTHLMIGFNWETQQDITDTVSMAVYLKHFGLADVNFFVVKTYPGTPLHAGLVRLQVKQGMSDSQVYDAWSVQDWLSVQNPKVRAKLRRFNDIPVISMHPVLDSLSLRRLARNAYEIFFSDADLGSVPDRLWRNVAWEGRTGQIGTAVRGAVE